jgi:hypothetical protein
VTATVTILADVRCRRERQQRAICESVAEVFEKLVDGPVNEADAKAVGELAFDLALTKHPQLFDEGKIQNDTTSGADEAAAGNACA